MNEFFFFWQLEFIENLCKNFMYKNCDKIPFTNFFGQNMLMDEYIHTIVKNTSQALPKMYVPTSLSANTKKQSNTLK